MQQQLTTTLFFSLADRSLGSAGNSGTTWITERVAMLQEQPTVVTHAVKMMGGGVQMAVRLIASMLSSGDIRIDGQATLVEHAGESVTNIAQEHVADIEGESIFSLLVPQNRLISQIVPLRHHQQADDVAYILLALTNQMIPSLPPELVVRRRILVGIWLMLIDCVTFVTHTNAYLVIDRLVSTGQEQIILQLPQEAHLLVDDDGAAAPEMAAVALTLRGVALANGDIRIDGTAGLQPQPGRNPGESPEPQRFSILIPKDHATVRTIALDRDDPSSDCAIIALKLSNQPL